MQSADSSQLIKDLRADTTTSTGEENSDREDNEDNEDENEEEEEEEERRLAVNGSVNMSAQPTANSFYPMPILSSSPSTFSTAHKFTYQPQQFNSAGYYSDVNHSSSSSSIDGWSQL
jgi:hypothetical protein